MLCVSSVTKVAGKVFRWTHGCRRGTHPKVNLCATSTLCQYSSGTKKVRTRKTDEIRHTMKPIKAQFSPRIMQETLELLAVDTTTRTMHKRCYPAGKIKTKFAGRWIKTDDVRSTPRTK